MLLQGACVFKAVGGNPKNQKNMREYMTLHPSADPPGGGVEIRPAEGAPCPYIILRTS